MQAKTVKERVIKLVDGTRLVPTYDFVDITDKESKDKFTLFLVEQGEIVLKEEPKTKATRAKKDADNE